MKRSGSNEENEFRVNVSELRVDNGAFDDGQEVSLDTCASESWSKWVDARTNVVKIPYMAFTYDT